MLTLFPFPDLGKWCRHQTSQDFEGRELFWRGLFSNKVFAKSYLLIVRIHWINYVDWLGLFRCSLRNLSLLKSSPSRGFFKIGVLKNFADLTRKNLCWSLFLIELEACRIATLLKREFNTGVFLWNLKKF